jgi:transposase
MCMSTDAPAALPDDVALCHALIGQLSGTVSEQQRRLAQLEHQLALLLRAHCGPRSEKVDPAQLALFESQPSSEEPTAEPAVPEQTIREHVRRGGGRKALPDDLPRQRVEHLLPTEQLPCPCCGKERTKFGEEISEQLEFVPAVLHVIEHVRFKYTCRHCQEHVAVAEKPPQPIDKGLPGPGLLAAIITSKFGDHLPLYRLEDIFARHGVELSRSTMCGWLKQTARLLLPLHDLMRRRVLRSKVIHTDDTKVPVIDADLPHVRNSRFWVYVGDELHPYVVFDYTRSRERDGPAQFLAGYEGYVQADAFSAYDGIYAGSNGKILEVACWAHARRKFFDVREQSPRLAHEALARIGKLYELERELKKWCAGDWQELPLAERWSKIAAVRQEHAHPQLSALRTWLDAAAEQTWPKSPIRQAINYALNQWDALTRYCEQGFLAIDNNSAERAVRPCAIGRKNWLFCGNDDGGRTAAVLFSMTSTAKRHGLDPFAWLRNVLTKLPRLQPAPGGKVPDELLAPLLPN